MALSPADFYAYSRATGAPVPEDAQERAEMAPEVLEFRRNQLKAPQQESNPFAALGTAALGLGALAGLGFGARALMGRRQQIPKGPAKSATAGVRQVNLADMEQAVRRVAAEPAPATPPPAPSKIASRSVMPTEEEAFTQYRRQLAAELPEPTAEELNFPAAEPRVYGVGYRERQAELGYRSAALAAFEKKYPPSPELQAARRAAAQQDLLNAAARIETNTATLTDLQKIQTPANADQFINAVESGEDQLTGRVVKQINIADPWGEATISPDVVNQQLTIPLPTVAEITPQEQAQSFLQSRFEELGATIPGRYRRERAMGTDPAIAEAMELYASTGDPAVLSRLSQTPSSPLTIKPNVQLSINDPNLPTGQFFKPTGFPEYTGDLIQKDIELTNKISSLGIEKQNLIDKAKELGEQELMLRVAMDREPDGGAYSQMFGKIKYEQQNLPDPSSLDVDLGDALAERDFIRGQINSLENLGSTYKLSNLQEGVRPFFEYDEFGNIIPSTLALRTGRQSVDLGPKTKGGRMFAEYDPQGQTGSTKGVYGVEQTRRRSSPATRPTQVTTNELIEEALEQAVASPEGDVPIPPPQEQISLKYGPKASQKSLIASEAIRRATIEGRDPQMVLRELGFNV